MKKLIAITLAAAIVPSAAMASPTLYGKIHMGINYLDNNSKSVANGGVGEYSSMSLTSVFPELDLKDQSNLVMV